MERVLLVRLGALGDIVHTIPVAAALRRAWPSARIDWLVSARHREILDLVSVLDRRIVLNERGASWRVVMAELRRARYDVAIDLQGLIKSAVIARLSGARRVIGFSGKYAREPLARLFYTEAHDPGGEGMYAPSERRHVVQINLELLKPLGLVTTAAEFPIDVPSSAVARSVAAEAKGRYALLNPGAAWPNKRWPAARLGALARALRERRGIPSVVIWGPDERALAEQVVEESGGAAVLSPPTTVGDLVALARGAAVMVSGDTGPTHIATAVGTPVVGIFGPTRPERNGPLSAQDEIVSRAAVCRCHHLRRCTQERMCLLDVGVSDVFAAVERRLAAAELSGG